MEEEEEERLLVRSGVGRCEVLTDLWCVDVRLGREVRGD